MPCLSQLDDQSSGPFGETSSINYKESKDVISIIVQYQTETIDTYLCVVDHSRLSSIEFVEKNVCVGARKHQCP